MNKMHRPGAHAARRILLRLLVTATAVLAARSQECASAVTTAAAVYTVAGQDRRSRP